MNIEALPRSVELLWCASTNQAEFVFVDQTRLPEQLVFECAHDHLEVICAIKTLAVRGAPAIGVAGAAALVLFAVNESDANTTERLLFEIETVAPIVATARPTAINLAWAVGHMVSFARRCFEQSSSVDEMRNQLFVEVKQLESQDEASNRAIGEYGATLLESRSRVLTHCNAGSLATVFYGTALGVIYTAATQGKIEHVWVDETRPVGQGARLTTWELARAGVPLTLICDNMAASIMEKGLVDAVIVGADRICANGDTANKIGTYGLAVLARYHNIPFYVAAPTTSIDMTLAAGAEIPIEQRSALEISSFVSEGIAVYNPAFDVTPAQLITAIITDRGVMAPDQVNGN